ncbi:MAG: YdcF family protein [Deltaproteobacteria bacterium]|nr:YdcF family protein [Deltaproteobacteria bacterium]
MIAWLLVLLVLATGGKSIWDAARGERRLVLRWAGGAGVSALLLLLIFHSDLAMQKLFGSIAMPTGLLWLGAGGLSVALLARGQRRSGALALAIFLGLGIAGNAWFSGWLMGQLEGSVPAIEADECPPLDAILLVGGGVETSLQGRTQLSERGDRLLTAVRLFRAGRTRVLVTSGRGIPGLHATGDLTLMTQALFVELGVPEAAIVRLPEPQNTSQEIAAFKGLVAREGWAHVGVVSSAGHLPRIAGQLRRQGLDAVLIAADHRSSEPPGHPALLIPRSAYLASTEAAAWEVLGRLVGR